MLSPNLLLWIEAVISISIFIIFIALFSRELHNKRKSPKNTQHNEYTPNAMTTDHTCCPSSSSSRASPVKNKMALGISLSLKNSARAKSSDS